MGHEPISCASRFILIFYFLSIALDATMVYDCSWGNITNLSFYKATVYTYTDMYILLTMLGCIPMPVYS